MGVLLIQNDFTHGELDRKLFSRVDLNVYNKAAQQLRNVVVIPQGGARRRFGTEFIFDAGTIADDEYKLEEFEFSDSIAYLLFFDNLRIRLFRDDAKVGPDIVTPYTGTMLSDQEVRSAQTHDLMVIVQGDTDPKELKINTGTNTGTLTNITFRNLPAVDFQGTNYDGFSFTLSAITLGTTTLVSGGAIFTTDHVGGLFISLGPTASTRNGVARIVTFISNVQVTVEVISEFGALVNRGFSSFVGEVAWSSNRGFPKSVTFYEGRLWFGGTRELPQSFFGSVVNDFFNFDEGAGQADRAISLTMATDTINDIRDIVGDRSLQIFTTTGEFTVPQLEESPLTPSNISIRKQSSNGVTKVEPILLDNQTFYVRRGGKAIMSFIYSNTVAGYNSVDASVLSSQVISSPVDGAVRKGSSIDDANYLFLINSTGTLAIYQTILDQRISAWTLSNTKGLTGNHLFKRTQNVQDEVYFLIKRTIDGVDKIYLEKLNFDFFSDSVLQSSFGGATTIITGLAHLEGETVKVRGETTGAGDGFFVLPDATVIGGQITLSEGVFTVQVGLSYEPIIQPMPINILTGIGPAAYIPKRVTRIFIDFFESVGVFIQSGPTEIDPTSGLPVFVNDTPDLIPYRLLDPAEIDKPPTVFSEVFEYNSLGGWDVRQAPIITQPDPLPMTILGLGYEVEL